MATPTLTCRKCRKCRKGVGRKEIAVPSKDYIQLLQARISEEISSASEGDFFVNDDQRIAIIGKHADDIGSVVIEHFRSFDSKELFDKASEPALLTLFRKSFSPQSSGFVIAGFGTDEHFPALVSYEIDGYVGDVLKVSDGSSTEISRELSSSIQPFAQREMVVRFMDGIDPALANALQKIFTTTLTSACIDVLEKYGNAASQTDATRQLIHEAALAAITSVGGRLKEIQKVHFSRPITQMVSLLPKDELPHLAESLVALTSLKRHVSRDAETVGGPIDVCLISKGDGFVWIKRKPELNPQFVRNYMRDVTSKGEGDEGPRTRDSTRSARKRNQKKADKAALAK